jgi:hypothetical protein
VSTTPAIALLGLVAAVGALYSFQLVLGEALLGYAASAPWRLLASAVLLSSRGPIAIIGFLTLLWSFALRHRYING